jgi:hypothetical protein
MDFEDREVPPRSLDHDCLARREVAAGRAVRAMPDAEERAQRGHVEPAAGAVDDAVEGTLHHGTGAKEQVAAAFDLVDRVAVDEAAAFLIAQVQREAEARAVDPAVDDLAEAPYRRGLRQGVCDLGQACGCVHPREAVSLLREADAGRLCLAGDVLMPVEDHLGAERRMAAHLDREVPQVGSMMWNE